MEAVDMLILFLWLELDFCTEAGSLFVSMMTTAS